VESTSKQYAPLPLFCTVIVVLIILEPLKIEWNIVGGDQKRFSNGYFSHKLMHTYLFHINYYSA
jgi:hypothetical protein